MTIHHEFYTDRDVARLLNMSASWVRGQRFRRRHNKPHILDVEPRYIGSSARYVAGEVNAFIAKLVG